MTSAPPSFADFLNDLRARVAPVEIESGVAWWEANTRSSPETEARAGEAQKALSRVYADRDAFAVLQSYDPGYLSSDEARQWMLLRNAFLANQMEDAVLVEMVDIECKIESIFNVFRPSLRGEQASQNRLREILRTSDDVSLRRDAWEAAKAIGPIVAGDVLSLVALRNTEARRHGYPDYYHFALALQEIEPATLFSLLDEIEAETNAAYSDYKRGLDQTLATRFGCPVSALRAHHYGDPFFQEAPAGEINLDGYFAGKDLPALATAFFDAIGLDVRDVLARSDLYERDAKSQHAFCIHIGRGEDVRVLCNCTPTEQWMGTLLHELGHAVYDKYLGDDLPFFLRETAHILTTEAIAMLFGRFSRNAAYLVRYAGVAPAEAQAVARSAARKQSAGLLIMARWCLVMAHFERALYADPAQDLNTLWWTLVARFQHITPPDNRPSAPDWASKLHLALSPVYYHNYLLGEMFASQLLDHLRDSVAPGQSTDDAVVASAAVGAYLRTAIFAPGARFPWSALVTQATGTPLATTHFVRHLSAG
jgi:peptidyl-dipeptidase A